MPFSRRTLSAFAVVVSLVTHPTLDGSAIAAGQGIAAATAAEEEAYAGWCQSWEEAYGWYHDFDLFGSMSTHECYNGHPNSWHYNHQPGLCATYHTPDIGCLL